GTTPHKWLLQQRVLRARELLEATDSSVETIAREVGFGSAAVLRAHFQTVLGTSPQRYRRAFSPPQAPTPPPPPPPTPTPPPSAAGRHCLLRRAARSRARLRLRRRPPRPLPYRPRPPTPALPPRPLPLPGPYPHPRPHHTHCARLTHFHRTVQPPAVSPHFAT